MTTAKVNTAVRWLDTIPLALPSNVLSGSFQVSIPNSGLTDIAVLNPTQALISYATGKLTTKPGDCISVQPYANQGLPFNETQSFTVFWSSSSYVDATNNIVTLLVSNYSLAISGGPNTAGGVASNVSVVGTPNVNVNVLPDLHIVSLPSVVCGNLDVPTSSVITALGVVETDINAVTTAVNAVTTAVNAVTTAVNAVDADVKAGSSVFYDGINSAVVTVASAVGVQACREVLLIADVNNTDDIFVGNAISQSNRVKAGQSLTVPTSNINLLYVKSNSGTQVVTYLARG